MMTNFNTYLLIKLLKRIKTMFKEKIVFCTFHFYVNLNQTKQYNFWRITYMTSIKSCKFVKRQVIEGL